MINRSFKEFKRIHKKKLNQVIYSSLNIKNESFLINLTGLINLTSGRLRSFLHLLGMLSIYLIISYEKKPEIIELIGGRVFEILNLKLSIIFSIIFFGDPLIFLFFCELIE